MIVLRTPIALAFALAVFGGAVPPAHAKAIFSCECNDDCVAAGPTDVCIDSAGVGRICCPASSFCPASPGPGIPCGSGTDAAPPGTDAAGPGTDATVPGTDAAGSADSGQNGSDATAPGADGSPGTDAGPDDGRGGCDCRVGEGGASGGGAAGLLGALTLLVVARRGRSAVSRGRGRAT